jgi:rhodanese-related sulfurtransferase
LVTAQEEQKMNFKFGLIPTKAVMAAGITLLSIIGWLVGCAPNSGRASIAAPELLQQIQTGQAPYIVDVREPEELQGSLGALPGVKNIPLSEIGQRLGEIPKDRKVALICRSGNRSGQAYGLLKKEGYTQIENVQGGMLAVRAAERK